MGLKWKALFSCSMLSEAGDEVSWINLEENSLNVNMNFGAMGRWILHVQRKQTRLRPKPFGLGQTGPTALRSAFWNQLRCFLQSFFFLFFSGHAAFLWFCWHLLASAVSCKYRLGFVFVYLHFSFALILTLVHVSSCLYTDRREDLPPAVRSLKPLLFLLPHCETNRDF